MASRTFLTYHARVLLLVAHDPGVRLRDIAASLNITERSAKRQDHVIDLADAPLPFHHDLRLECRLPVPRHRDPHRARRRSDRLPGGAIPGIPRPVSRRVAFHVAEVIVHFGAQRPLEQRLLQLLEKPVRTCEVFRLLIVSKQLIQ